MSFACSGFGSVEPLVTGADVVRGCEIAGEAFANKLLSYGHEALKAMARRDGILAASVRSASSSGSLATGSIGRAGLTGTRLESIRKVDSWRTGGDSVGTGGASRPKYPDGFCYGKLFVRSAAQDQVSRLGSWPTFGSLVRLSARKFKSLADLERFRVVEQAQGVYHVAAGGSAGCSFLDAVASYGGKIRAQPGTLVADVLASGRKVGPEVSCRVTGKSCVGGFSSDSVPSGFSDGLVSFPTSWVRGDRVWKPGVGLGKVQVVFGTTEGGRTVTNPARARFVSLLSGVPAVFDSLDVQGDGWAYLSSSVKSPTLAEYERLRVLFSSAGYSTFVTPLGEWKFVRSSAVTSSCGFSPENAWAFGFHLSGADYVVVLQRPVPVHPSQLGLYSSLPLTFLRECVGAASGICVVRDGKVERCGLEAVFGVIDRLEYVCGGVVRAGTSVSVATLPVRFERGASEFPAVVKCGLVKC